MATPRLRSAAVSIPGVGIVVVGGLQPGSRCTRTAELLAVSKHRRCENWSWRTLLPMLETRYQPGIAYFNGCVVVAGGNGHHQISVESLKLSSRHPSHSQWTHVDGFTGANSWFCSLVVYNGKLLLADDRGRVTEYTLTPNSDDTTQAEFKARPFATIENIAKPSLLVVRKQH
uniref:Bulb-type lectin domain-containing protein n=1 Tax=Mesocestoides corti TaxID=53468 RepID=A0A5K3G381_MESCO